MGVMNCEAKGQHQTGIWPALVEGFDPNQVFVLSGPYPSQDHYGGIMVAHPVPPGATVIAKPIIPGLPELQNMSVPVPYPMMPEQLKQSFAPQMMVWTNRVLQGTKVAGTGVAAGTKIVGDTVVKSGKNIGTGVVQSSDTLSSGNVVGATAAVGAGVVNTIHGLGTRALEGTKVVGDTVKWK